MGFVVGGVLVGRVSGEYVVQCSGLVDRGLHVLCGMAHHSRNVCV